MGYFARFGAASRYAAAVLLAIGLCVAPAVFADSTGEHSPTSTAGTYTNATNALVCDSAVADATSNNQTQVFQDFGLSLPGNAIITGIQLRVRANDSTKTNRKFQVTLSWNGGTTYTSGAGVGVLQTSNFRRNSPLRDYIVGGSAVTWGRTWTAAEFADANFRVKTNSRLPGSNPSADPAHLDCLPVTVFYRIPGAPNLSVDKIDSPDPVQPDSELTYTLSYGNTGESTATNVLVSDTVPANTTFVSASPAPVSAPAVGGTGTVSWNVGSVAFGQTGLVTLVVKTDPSLANGTVISNSTYSIDSGQNSPTFGNGVTTTVQGTIALSLSKQGSPNPVAPAGTLAYLLTIQNGGNALSTNIIVNEAYDPNTAYASYSTTCSGVTKLADDQWQIGSLAAGATCTLTINVTVGSPLADGVLITNNADIFDDANNAAQASAINQIRNPAVCGDGVITMPEEECDEGVDNGTTGSCCTNACTIRAAGQTCRPASGECDVAETCDGTNATCPTDAFVTAGIDCTDDGNGCTDDECDGGGTCGHPANTAPCSDGLFCNGADTCGGGTCSQHDGDPCIGGSECNDTCNETNDNCNVAGGTGCTDDGNLCTGDICNGGGVCVHPNNTASCDDGVFCNGADTCSAGSCSSHAGDPCTGGAECANACNETANNCYDAAGTTCTDDGNVCTNDACNGVGGCIHQNNSASCSDGQFCNGTDTCSGGSCSQHSGDPCASGPECNDSCDESADNCAVNAGTACTDDGNVCTNDQCNGLGSCAHPNNTSSCSDGQFCNGTDTCAGGACSVHSGDPCAGGSECDNTCNEGSDNCLVTAGAVCTDDGNVCTDDACDGAGQCGHPNNILSCNDGSVCSINDVCSNGTCAGTSVRCGDGVFQPSCAEQCDDGNTVSGDGCSSDCKLEPCGPEPEVGCAQPAIAQAAILALSNSSTVAKDRVIWKWSKGAETQKGDFGSPTTTDDYQFCIYRATAPMLLMSATAPAGGTCDGKPCWKESSSGFRYKDKSATPNGVTGITLKAGPAQTALIKLKGMGIDLPMFNLSSIAPPLVVQMKNMNTGKCWEAVYSAPALKSTDTKFKDRAD